MKRNAGAFAATPLLAAAMMLAGGQDETPDYRLAVNLATRRIKG